MPEPQAGRKEDPIDNLFKNSIFLFRIKIKCLG